MYDKSGNVLEVGKVGTYLKEVDRRDIYVGTVVEVRYQEVIDDLKFKHPPLIIRMRRDKAPSECSLTQLFRRR